MADDIRAEMPAPVEPVPGADVVNFPWDEAATAVAVLHDAAATLRAQLDDRSLLLPSIVDWEGSYRDDFDVTYQGLILVTTGLAASLTSRASGIVSVAESAKAKQITNNVAAEEAAAQAVRDAQAAQDRQAAADALTSRPPGPTVR